MYYFVKKKLTDFKQEFISLFPEQEGLCRIDKTDKEYLFKIGFHITHKKKVVDSKENIHPDLIRLLNKYYIFTIDQNNLYRHEITISLSEHKLRKYKILKLKQSK